MILEMTGLPGGGKTYTSNKIVRLLDKQGKRAINVIDIQRNNLVIKVLWRISKCFAKYDSNYKKDLSQFRDFFMEYESTESSFTKVEIQNYINQLAFLRYLYRKLSSSSKLYIFDEGIIQTLCSMTVYFDIDLELYDKYLKYILPEDIKVVYICVSQKIAIESIKDRDRHVCAMDEFDGEKLNIFLAKYEKVCNFIIEESDCLQIHRNDKLENNLDKVIDYLNSKKYISRILS